MTEDQIQHMTRRFLSWKLPMLFAPDGGISFEHIRNVGTPHEARNEPSGTNLLHAGQAEAMVRHITQGMPASVGEKTYDQGRRDVLNAILELNPEVARKLHAISCGEEIHFDNTEGRLPFDVVYWVVSVAEQLKIVDLVSAEVAEAIQA